MIWLGATIQDAVHLHLDGWRLDLCQPVMVTPLSAAERYDGQQMTAQQLRAAMERENEKRVGRWN